MKNNTHILGVFVLGVFAVSCTGANYQFGFGDLQFVALNLDDEDGVAQAIDVDNDGIADGIDTDMDGNIDIDFNGNDVDGDQGDTTSNSGNNSNPDDLRDGNCLIKGRTLLLHSKSVNVSLSDLIGFDNLWIVSKGRSQTFSVDLGSSSIDRLIVTLTGNSNTLNLVDGNFDEGVCVDKINGDSNRLEIRADASVPLVDLKVGGGENLVNIKTALSQGISYELSGKDDCLSFLSGTQVNSSSAGSNEILSDGSFCF